ncbi:uncharacterized protein LOC129796644 [Lutzomyia longipalpis]|uniref:uncharacterized protein LOC129796644 n=1 Tax=Lutzomyia longipalpis TaxID=7200 RepID=UPI0024835890|nr:uncharacterized protein LOC129796644 [Lutzomyia longipalpis]
MGPIKFFLVIFILSLSKKFLVRAEDGFLDILQPRGDLNGSIFDLEITISSEILNSGHGNNAKGAYRLKIISYDKDKIHISIEMKELKVQNGEIVEPPLDYLVNIPKNNPIDFILTSSGKIILRKNEATMNWNFYKTISNFLLFDATSFNKVKKDERGAFTVSMPTIYGTCDIESLTQQTGWSTYVVEQFFDPTTCTNFNDFSFTDVEKNHKNYNLRINNYRMYNLVQKKDIITLDSLKTSQKIFWKPTEGQSLTHYLQMTYNFTFIEETALSLDDANFDFSNDKNLELLTTNGEQFQNDSSFLTLESMENFNNDQLISSVKNELKKIAHFWGEHLINANHFTEPLPQEIVKTISILELFEYDQIVELWKSLKGDTTDDGYSTLNIFYNLIPLTGSEASVLFIVKKLTFDGGISSIDMALKMLTKLAGSIRNPSFKVLEALKEVAESKSSAAVLAYTAAVGTAYERNASPELLKYIQQVENEMFSVIFDSLHNQKQLRLYIQALGNLGSVSLRDSRIVKLLSTPNDDIHLYCIQALERSTPNIFDLMVKILREGHRSSGLKVVALRVALMNLPSEKDFEILARIMDAQVNNEIYNLFESAVRTLIKDNVLPKTTELWLRQRVPMRRSTAFVYHSPKNLPMPVAVRGAVFFNDLTWALEQIHLSIYQTFNGKNVKMYSVFIRLIEANKITTLSNFGKNLMEQEKLNYEFTFYRGAKVIMSVADKYDFKSTLADLLQLFQDFTLLPFKIDMGDIFQHINLDYFFPTDAGKYAHLYFSVPWMISTKFNSLKIAEDSVVMNILASLNFTAQSATGMYIYQPKLQVLQGTREVSSVIFTEQIAFKVYRESQIQKFTFVVELTDALTPLFGIRFRKFTYVHFNRIGELGEPIASNQDDKLSDFFVVSPNYLGGSIYGDKYEWHTDFGAKFHSQASIHQAPFGNYDTPNLGKEILFTKAFTDLLIESEGDFFVSLISYINWNFLANSAYTYNFKALLEPSDVFSVKKYSLQVSMNYVLIEFKDTEDRVKVYYKITQDPGNGIQFMRMIPGGKSSMWCLTELKDELDESIHQFTYGTDDEDILECTKDQFQILFRTRSEFSKEQIHDHNDKRLSYIECLHQSPYLQNWDPTNTYTCAQAAHTLRDMTININYKNAPKEFTKFFENFWIWFLQSSHGIPSDNNPINVEGPGAITIKINFPMKLPRVNLEIFLPDKMFSFTFPSDFLIPDNTAISDFSTIIEFLTPSPMCTVVAVDSQRKSRDHYLPRFTDSWTPVAKINQVYVSVKKIFGDQLSLKIDYQNQTIIANPKNNSSTSSDKFEVIIGENILNDMLTSQFNKKIQKIFILNTIFFTPDAFKWDQTFVIGYNGQSVMITESSKADYNSGPCFGLQDTAN